MNLLHIVMPYSKYIHVVNALQSSKFTAHTAFSMSGSKWPNRYSNPVALRSVALRFRGFGGMSQENRATPPEKGPVAPPFSALKGGAALQVASWKVSRYRGGVAATLSPVALQWATYPEGHKTH